MHTWLHNIAENLYVFNNISKLMPTYYLHNTYIMPTRFQTF